MKGWISKRRSQTRSTTINKLFSDLSSGQSTANNGSINAEIPTEPVSKVKR
jgi:hypothetical protein